jgi:hypothetical protein
LIDIKLNYVFFYHFQTRRIFGVLGFYFPPLYLLGRYGNKLLILNYFYLNFGMKDLGEVDVILGIKIIRTPNFIKSSHLHYTNIVLKILVIPIMYCFNPL